jgi:hypothetical protein
MPFVYKGSGKKQREDAPLAAKRCTRQACDIQWCLAKNDHDQKKCEWYIAQYEKCVETWTRIEKEKKESEKRL